MSLSYDVTRVKDYTKVCIDPDTGKLNGLTKGIVLCMMSIGLNEITRDNAAEVYARFKLLEKIHGSMFTLDTGGEYYIEPEDIHKHINLHTNAGVSSTKEFFRKLVGPKLDEYETDYLSYHFPDDETGDEGKGVL